MVGPVKAHKPTWLDVGLLTLLAREILEALLLAGAPC